MFRKKYCNCTCIPRATSIDRSMIHASIGGKNYAVDADAAIVEVSIRSHIVHYKTLNTRHILRC